MYLNQREAKDKSLTENNLFEPVGNSATDTQQWTQPQNGCHGWQSQPYTYRRNQKTFKNTLGKMNERENKTNTVVVAAKSILF